MREIKFRGKRRKGGAWAFGLLGMGISGAVDEISGFGNSEHLNQYNTYRVHIETIGQLTPLRDRKLVDIYEGDIVQEYIMDDLFQVVFTDYANFGLKPISKLAVKNLPGHEYETIDPSYSETSLTVIGNIHDNPELLK